MFSAIKKSILVASSLVLLGATTAGVVSVSKTTANAESPVAISTSALVAQSTMTVTPAYENVGLYLEKTANYQSATMAGSFNGDLTIEYSLVSAGARSYFDFYNSNNELVFSVVRYGPYTNKDVAYASGAYISYKANSSASKQYAYLDTNKEIVNTSTEPIGNSNRTKLHGGAMPIVYATTLEKSGVGYITLDWADDGMLTVKMPYSKNNVVSEETIATIDLSGWEGLSSAYSLKFNYDASYNYQANVLLRSVNGVSLAGETVTTNTVSSGIIYEGESVVDGVATIKIAKGENLATFSSNMNTLIGERWNIGAIASETFSYAEDFSTKTEGVYSINVTYGGFSKNYNVIVLPIKNTSELFSVGNQITTSIASYNNGAIVGYQALSSTQVKNGDIIAFNGVFTDDFELEYFLPDPTEKSNAPNEGIVFEVSDIDGNILFKVVRKAKWGGHPGESWEHGTYVYDANGSELATRVNDYPVNGSTRFESAYQFSTGKIQFSWTNNGVVISTTNKTSGELSVLATVADISLPIDGYKVAIKATASGYYGGVVLVNVNRTNLTATQTAVEHQSRVDIEGFFDGETLYVPQNGTIGPATATAWISYSDGWISGYTTVDVETWLGTYDLSVAGNYTISAEFSANDKTHRKEIALVVEPSYKITFDVQGGQELADIYYSEHTYQVELPVPVKSGWDFLGWYNGATKIEGISLDLENVTLVANWLDDDKPELTLNGFEDLTTIEQGAESGLNISKSNVNAVDAAWGTLPEENITISIKAPNEFDFVDFNEFVFNELSFGVYVVKYVAVDGSENQNEITREIRYIPARATLIIEGTILEQSFLGKEIKLPIASANYNGTPLNVSISVEFSNEAVALTDNGFTPLNEGTYTVVYSTIDEYERYVAETFIIEVIADTEKPIISVTFDTAQLYLGDTLVLPTATAKDDVDGDVEVSVVIVFNNVTVATSSFVVNEKGVYTVVYTAKDSAGNEAKEQFDVVVGEKQDNSPAIEPDNGNDGNGCNGCNSSLSAIPIGIVFIAVTVVLIVRKKRKKIDNE